MGKLLRFKTLFSPSQNPSKTLPFSQIQAHLITSGRPINLSSKLSNDLHHTLLIFNCITSPDAFFVNSVIKSYSSHCLHREAVTFYVEMLRDGIFNPNSYTFPPLLSACAKLGSVRTGEMCHSHVHKFKADFVLPVQNSLIHMYACCGFVDVAWKVFDEMSVRDLVSWNTIVDGWAKVGEMGFAHKVFDEMRERNVVSWNVMMTGYLKFGSPGNVMKLFREMMGGGVRGNGTSVVNVVTACGRSSNLREGRSVHGFVVKTFDGLSLILGSAIVDMYCKCGRVDLARVMFDRMGCRSLVSWNTMILGYCIHGDPVEGLSLYSEMVDGNRILPDGVTFIGILCGCARKGMLAEGKRYFSDMINVFNLKPNFAHYWCMANLVAGVGLMQEAVDILKNIPPDEDDSLDSSLWAGLFGSCRFLGDVTLGEQIAIELIEQYPRDFSYYNLLVNIYAAGGRWEEVARTKDMMKERGIKRVPCCGLKDLTEIVSNVEVGGEWHKDSQMGLIE